MQNNNPLQTALILAAGTGSRLRPYTNHSPKCLTMVAGQPILLQQLNHLRNIGIRKLVMVIGYMGEQIRSFIKANASDFEVEWVYNESYASTNNIYSLWLARSFLRNSFILLESDLVFDGYQLKQMKEPDSAAVSEHKAWMSGTHVEIDNKNKILRFDMRQNGSERARYKTVNIYTFSHNSWCHIQQRLSTIVARGQLDRYYETALADLTSEKAISLKAVKFDPDHWYEIDTPTDLKAASEQLIQYAFH